MPVHVLDLVLLRVRDEAENAGGQEDACGEAVRHRHAEIATRMFRRRRRALSAAEEYQRQQNAHQQ